MASEWAEEADRQAKAMTRDLIETGRKKGFRVEYQKREARFALRAGTINTYFSAHDYKSKNGAMDWLRLRIDVFSFVRFGPGAAAAAAVGDEQPAEKAKESPVAEKNDSKAPATE
jgi:hypothetical protein